MLKIATHNSATGEKPMGLLSWLLIPFARTQSKTIKEQYEAGCRMFDLRIRLHEHQWRFAHGPMILQRGVGSVLSYLANKGDCYVTLTYEGGMEGSELFEQYVRHLQEQYPGIHYGDACVKYGVDSKGVKVSYTKIIPATCKWPAAKQGFLPLDGKTWHTYLPIPWLWKKLYHNKPEFNNETFIYVDFL